MNDPNTPATCPTCDSPDPKRHPAMQFEGEVSICPDPFHSVAPPAIFNGTSDEFHALWTDAVGKPGYDKRAWQEAEKRLKFTPPTIPAVLKAEPPEGFGEGFSPFDDCLAAWLNTPLGRRLADANQIDDADISAHLSAAFEAGWNAMAVTDLRFTPRPAPAEGEEFMKRQFIGVTDRDGTPIHEGHILWDGVAPGRVRWLQEECAFVVYSKKPTPAYHRIESDGQLRKSVIIGTYDDSPEMMEDDYEYRA